MKGDKKFKKAGLHLKGQTAQQKIQKALKKVRGKENGGHNH